MEKNMRIQQTALIVALTAGSAFAQCGATAKANQACENDVVAHGTDAVMVQEASYQIRAGNIVETAKKAGSFNTLLAAAQAAGLAEPLMNDGPFTVFAPTDEAFAALPAGTVESLLKPENKARLAAILKYHVVPGTLNARTVTRLSGATSLLGQRIPFAVNADKVAVGSANVIKPDIICSNGVIHVIDRVILPTSDNIAQVAESAGMFNTLLAAAQAAGLVDALTGEGPLTVFAPTDEAFAALPAGTVETLLKPENKSKLAAILKYHVVPGRVSAAEAAGAKAAQTLNGQSVVIDIADGTLRVDGAKVIRTDVNASNGVIHVIDRVILPE